MTLRRLLWLTTWPGRYRVKHEETIERSVWCCLPVYNNAGTIVDVATRCREVMEQVVVVDDGSSDADLRELLSHLDVMVIRHDKNLGKGAALLTGFEYIRSQGGRFAITLDGDGQHDPADIPRFLPFLDEKTLLLGRRENVKGEMPASSLFGREFSDFWVELETGVQARDTQSGFRVYPLLAMEKLAIASRHYNYEVEAVTRGLWAGLSVRDVPISVWYPARAERVSSFDQKKDNLRLAQLHTRLGLRQLLPWPHRKLFARDQPCVPLWRRNASPTGLAMAAALSMLLCTMHGPWGLLAMLYLAWRWHFNGAAIAVPAVAGGLLYWQAQWMLHVGGLVVDRGEHPLWAWFIGSHLIGPMVAMMAGLVVYKIARWQQPLGRDVRRVS